MSSGTLKRKSVESSLAQKGFDKIGSDHEMYVLVVDGKRRAVRTKISRGSSYRELSKNMIHKISKDLKMRTPKFYDFVKCTYTYEAYVKDLFGEN